MALFVVLGTTYSVVVPPFEASDELWHYPMVKYIADNWRLPVQVPGVETPWRQEGSQAPLYYFVGALATCWIDTSDMETARYLNHHVDNGVATADGNINLVVHHPARESFPWQGTVLAIHLIRLLSVGMGAAAVYLTYLIAREVVPGRPALALASAAVHAFTPMYVFISGAVNNDNLVVPLSSLALLMLLRLLRQRAWTTRQALPRYLALGVVLGLAALTKYGALVLAVLTALVVGMRALRQRSWTEFFVGGFATLLPLLTIAGWWYVRNVQLYGDLFGLNAFKPILGTRDVPADLAQLWRERYSFAAGYWGNFGGLNVPMPRWVYGTLNALAAAAALGLVVLLLRSIRQKSHPAHSPRLGGGVPGTEPGANMLPHKRLSIRGAQFVICALFGLIIVVSWSQWARDTWSSQGRLIFTAIPVWSLLLVLGLSSWLPRRWASAGAAALAVLLLILSVAAPWLWIRPAYAQPQPLTDAQVAAIAQPAQVDFAGVMRLLGYDLETGAVEAGGQVSLTLYWEALAATDHDYTVFVHLVNEQDLLLAQRDTYPGLGRLSTTWLEPGFRWADRYVIPVPDTAYAPDAVRVDVGLYDRVSEMRLPATGPAGEEQGDHVHFGRIQVLAWPGDRPNPISINFGDQMALAGYDLDRRMARPGETVTLTLHWCGLRRMEADYTVSAQLVDSQQRKAAQHDGWPLDGAAPTSTWQPGQELTDTYKLEIYPDAAPGVYGVQLVVYLYDEGQISHVPTVPAGGEMQADHVVLTNVRVGEP